MQLYDFMDNEKLEELVTAVEYVEYFTSVKQEVLIKLDAVNWSIINCKHGYEEMKAKILLETDFGELYGKNNDDVRASHIALETKEIRESLEGYKHKRSVYQNQIDTLNDIISINKLILKESQCNCGDEHNGNPI